MQLHDLKPKTKRKSVKRIGRGGSRGKTSGRGMKGQKARAGHSLRPEVRDLIKKLPKRRGYGTNRARTVNSSVRKAIAVNLGSLEREFDNGEKVTPAILREKKLIPMQKGKRSPVKILGTGILKKKLIVSSCLVSESAKTAIEKAGGKVEK